MIQSSPEYWEQRAAELSRTSLDTIRTSATAWASSTTALLGIFGTVAVVKGPDTLAQLSGVVQAVVAGLVIGAAVVAFVSVLTTALASRGPVKKVSSLTGPKLKLWTIRTASRARLLLRIGQSTALLAALAVLAAGVTAAVAGMDQSSAFYLVRTSGGTLQCGQLAEQNHQLRLTDSSGATILALTSGVAAVTPVTSCPG